PTGARAAVGVAQGEADELDVVAEAVEQHVPRRFVARIRREDDDAERVGDRERVADVERGAARPVKHEHERRRDIRLVTLRNVEEAVAVALGEGQLLLTEAYGLRRARARRSPERCRPRSGSEESPSRQALHHAMT